MLSSFERSILGAYHNAPHGLKLITCAQNSWLSVPEQSIIAMLDRTSRQIIASASNFALVEQCCDYILQYSHEERALLLATVLYIAPPLVDHLPYCTSIQELVAQIPIIQHFVNLGKFILGRDSECGKIHDPDNNMPLHLTNLTIVQFDAIMKILGVAEAREEGPSCTICMEKFQ